MPSVFKHLPIQSLKRGQYQPRQTFDDDALHELAQSILTQGLIEPLVVREIAHQQHEIIAGERRWRAAQLAGLTEVPCLIGDYTDQQAAAVTLVENIQRQDLNLIEEASAYQRLQCEFHFNQEEIAALIGKSRSHIANLLRLLTLCPLVQHAIRHHHLSLGHARALVGLSTSRQEAFLQQIQAEGWSVRQLEEAVRKEKKTPSLASPSSPDQTRLETQLAEQIGTPVQISTDETQGGWLKIKFFNADTLAGLLERMGLRYD